MQHMLLMVMPSEHHGYGYTCGFSAGLATGMGTGSQIETRAKPVPVAQVCGCGVQKRNAASAQYYHHDQHYGPTTTGQ
jgi:hypothetical protein